MGDLAASRRDAIRRQLALWGSVRTNDLAAQFGVSERTVQRDLDAIATAYATIKRVHGGLVTAAPQASDPELRIGMLVPVSHYYYADVVAGAVASATDLNVRLVLGDYDYREDLQSTALRRLGEVDLDGLIATVDHDSEGYGQLQRLGMPAVVIERPWHRARTPTVPAATAVDHIFSDHQAGAAIGLRHLTDLGHRSICCLLRPTATAVELRRGLESVGATVAGSATLQVLELPIDDNREVLRPAVDEVVGELIRRCRSGEITAVFVHADWEALELGRALRRAGIAVPDQVSLLAYDGVIVADAGLSAVSPQRHWIGRLAVETMVDRLRGRGRLSHGQRPGTQLSVIPQLVVRSSTARSPRAEEHQQ